MASIYEKPPHFKLQRTWNKKTILLEVYKLTSPNPRNKNKAEIHKDSGLYGIEFTVDKTIPDFNKAAEKVDLDYTRSSSLRTCSRVRWTWPVSMFFKNTYQNWSTTQQAIYRWSPTKTRSKASRVLSSSSSSVARMRRSFEIASWSIISLVELSRFKRTLEHWKTTITITLMSFSA